jgi:cation transport ATPase
VTAEPIPEHRKSSRDSARGPFLPMLLLGIGVLGWMAVQTVQLLGDRWAVQEATSQQATSLAAAHKIRVAADSLAAKMQALADRGNPNAQAVVAELKKRGITISPNTSTAAPP